MARDYALHGRDSSETFPAPDLPYRPPHPEHPPKIGLVGAGGVSEFHLAAYRAAGFEVAAICSRSLANAQQKAATYYPDALATDDFGALLADPEIAVLDLTPHPADRLPLIERALEAGKHVLSQKPFVDSLEEGARLCDLAEAQGVLLAVNQNGRWAPHFAYAREAVRAGLLGEIATIDFVSHWDHTWTAGTPFEEIHHLILQDFTIHWFDIATDLMANALPTKVYATSTRAPHQTIRPPFVATVVAEYATGTQIRIVFNAPVRHGQRDETVVAGSLGTLRAAGRSIDQQSITLHTDRGTAAVALDGTWFTSGFQGTMAELLCAIEQNRTPHNNARDNLLSLRFAQAAIRSADSGQPVAP
ncbi:Gfo/Idh/MocA family oxidoreductase [soil metagenome]